MKFSKAAWRRIFFIVCQAVFLVIAIDGLTRNIQDQAGWLGLLGLVIAFLPDILRRYSKLILPFTYEVALILFVFMSLVAGEYFNIYGKLLWWDDMLHFISGLVVGYIGLLALHIDDRKKKAVSGPWFAAVFVFSLVVMSAAVWEIFEFSVDQFVGGHMQYGLVDTMMDIIDATAGALIISFMGFMYYKFSRGKWLKGMFDTFVRQNPWVAKDSEGSANVKDR
jgi:uncharacterized membrane protein YjdF